MTNWTSLLLAPPPASSIAAQPPPSISILIPAYNAAHTIGEALESALVQRPAPLEVIVSDDGSEDDLDRALAGFGDRIRLVRGANRGLATARNRAAALARGTLLGMLDADDVWMAGRCAALTAAATARPDLSILTTDAVILRGGRREPASYYATRHFEVIDQQTAILRSNFIFGAGAVTASAFASVGGYAPAARWAEDWDLWLRLVLAGHRAGLVQAPLYEYRRHDASLTAQKVDLALGVLTVLKRTESLVTIPAAASTLAQTQREWQLRAARSACAMRDARCRELARAALRIPDLPLLVRARLTAQLMNPGSSRPTA